jgi:hypothetical protein
MAKITFNDKVALTPQPDIANENKCTADDLNEIKSSVNELYDTNAIQDITNQITWKSGYTLKDGKLWKQGKRIFGTMNISGSFSPNIQVTSVFTIPYSFPNSFVFGGFTTSIDQWAIPNGAAYVYMSQWGQLNVNSNANATFLRIQFEFVAN